MKSQNVPVYLRKLNMRVAVLAVLVFTAFPTAAAQERKPVLILFHGVGETVDDLRGFHQTATETEMFSEAVMINYDWKNRSISVEARRLFNLLREKFPEDRFVLFGDREGGLVAEWLAVKVKETQGKILRVITANTPLDGIRKSPQDAEAPTADDLTPASDIIRALKSSPHNDLSSVEFIRLWEKDSRKVEQAGALRKPPGNAGDVRQVVVMTRKYSVPMPRLDQKSALKIIHGLLKVVDVDTDASGGQSVRELFAQGERSIQQGDLVGALFQLKQTYLLAPGSAAVNYNLSLIYEAQDQLTAAIEHAQKYMQFAPEADDFDDVEARIFRLKDELRTHSRTHFNPADCHDIYEWAKGEQRTKRSRSVARRQTILEVLIASQKGDCENARKIVDRYEQLPR